jgi:glycine/D-amino acid oxidase-like deaminating enzyme
MSEIMATTRYDVVVIGGGFYGCFVAYQVAARYPDLSVVVLEKEKALFARASGTNQGQLHMGYMYSADVELAAECVRNAALFEEHFPEAVDHDIISYFGIHRDSEITPAGYEHFCQSLALPLEAAPQAKDYFGEDIVATYVSTEGTFNGVRLGAIMRDRMATHRVEVQLSRNVRHITPQRDGSHVIVLDDGSVLTAGTVYNTTFADMNPLHDRSSFVRVPIRCEVFLHFLLRLPPEYARLGVAVIRGRFASALPSTSRGGHLLAAAAFRRMEISDTVSLSEEVEDRQIGKTYAEAIRECSKYLPALREAVYRGHVIGTRAAFIDIRTGETTSRVTPLLHFAGIRNYHVILGGKVPCLFEALEPALAGIEA